jgi:phosphatidylglycerophosphatase A
MTRLIATFGGVGDLRPAPGTWGSLAALPFAWALHALGGFWAIALGTLRHHRHRLVGGGAGTGRQRRQGPLRDRHRRGRGPVHRALARLLGAAFAGVGVLDLWPGIVTAFLAFRLFDIWKPGPVGWADRQEGALGVMADDLIAGWMAALIVAVFAVIAHLILIPT